VEETCCCHGHRAARAEHCEGNEVRSIRFATRGVRERWIDGLIGRYRSEERGRSCVSDVTMSFYVQTIDERMRESDRRRRPSLGSARFDFLMT
jgi:hypothetical protein